MTRSPNAMHLDANGEIEPYTIRGEGWERTRCSQREAGTVAQGEAKGTGVRCELGAEVGLRGIEVDPIDRSLQQPFTDARRGKPVLREAAQHFTQVDGGHASKTITRMPLPDGVRG